MKGFGYFDGFGQLTRLTENMNDPDKLIPDEEEVDVPAPKRVSIPDGQNAAFKKITGAASEKKPEGEFDLGKGKKDQNVIFASNDLLGEECKSIMTAVEAFDWSNPDQGGLQVDEEPKEAAVDRTDEAKRDKALDTNTVKEKFKEIFHDRYTGPGASKFDYKYDFTKPQVDVSVRIPVFQRTRV